MKYAILVLFIPILFGCDSDDDSPAVNEQCTEFFCDVESRRFEMGFSTWPYAPTTEAVNDTYQFIANNSDIYSEHIDSQIPWSAWMNGAELPEAFTNDIASRASRQLPNTKLALSVSILNNTREELAFDYDGTVPAYSSLDDQHIEDAYVAHLNYITNELNPEYLIIALEVNELLLNAPDKWEDYKSLMTNVKARIKQAFPSLPISESITLHNFYEPNVTDPDSFISEIASYANAMDFVAISFYPFFKSLNTTSDFQDAFGFLHQQIDKPIAFSETGHLSEDLVVAGLNLNIPGNRTEQNDYLETLFTNAQTNNYEYIIWWTHRDYDELWNTFPDEVKDLGQLWISTGLINEDGVEKEGYDTWKLVFETGL